MRPGFTEPASEVGTPRRAWKSWSAYGKWDGMRFYVLQTSRVCSTVLTGGISHSLPPVRLLGKQGIPRTLAWVSAPYRHAQVNGKAKNEIKLGRRYMGAPEAAGW